MRTPAAHAANSADRLGCRSGWGLVLILCGWLLMLGGCERKPAPAPAPSTQAAAAPTVASLVPAATDLLLAMSAQDHLVGISRQDVERPGTRGLVRVGDYAGVDWERLAQVRPNLLVLQYSAEKLSPGFRSRAEEMGVGLLNLRIDRLDDLWGAIDQLGQAVNEKAKAAQLRERLAGQIEAVRQRVSGRPRTAALLVIDEEARNVVGPRNYLDDLLAAAGGRNVAEGMQKDYPTIDRERLAELDPTVIIQLLPDASPQVVEKARRMWAGMPQLAAVRAGRVHILTEWHVLLPASHVGELAERMAELLHPQAGAATRPATIGMGDWASGVRVTSKIGPTRLSESNDRVPGRQSGRGVPNCFRTTGVVHSAIRRQAGMPVPRGARIVVDGAGRRAGPLCGRGGAA